MAARNLTRESSKRITTRHVSISDSSDDSRRSSIAGRDATQAKIAMERIQREAMKDQFRSNRARRGTEEGEKSDDLIIQPLDDGYNREDVEFNASLSDIKGRMGRLRGRTIGPSQEDAVVDDDEGDANRPGPSGEQQNQDEEQGAPVGDDFVFKRPLSPKKPGKKTDEVNVEQNGDEPPSEVVEQRQTPTEDSVRRSPRKSASGKKTRLSTQADILEPVDTGRSRKGSRDRSGTRSPVKRLTFDNPPDCEPMEEEEAGEAEENDNVESAEQELRASPRLSPRKAPAEEAQAPEINKKSADQQAQPSPKNSPRQASKQASNSRVGRQESIVDEEEPAIAAAVSASSTSLDADGSTAASQENSSNISQRKKRRRKRKDWQDKPKKKQSPETTVNGRRSSTDIENLSSVQAKKARGRPKMKGKKNESPNDAEKKEDLAYGRVLQDTSNTSKSRKETEKLLKSSKEDKTVKSPVRARSPSPPEPCDVWDDDAVVVENQEDTRENRKRLSEEHPPPHVSPKKPKKGGKAVASEEEEDSSEERDAGQGNRKRTPEEQPPPHVSPKKAKKGGKAPVVEDEEEEDEVDDQQRSPPKPAASKIPQKKGAKAVEEEPQPGPSRQQRKNKPTEKSTVGKQGKTANEELAEEWDSDEEEPVEELPKKTTQGRQGNNLKEDEEPAEKTARGKQGKDPKEGAEPVAKKAAKTATKGRKEKVAETDEESEEEPVKMTTRGRRGKVVEEEEPVAKKTTRGRKGKASEEEEPQKKVTRGRRNKAHEEDLEDTDEEPAAKTTRGRKNKVVETDDESEDNDDGPVEKEPPKKKATRGKQGKVPDKEPAVKKTTKGRKGRASEDEDADKEPVKKTTKGRKGKASEDDEDNDEEEPQKKTTRGRQAKEPEEQPAVKKTTRGRKGKTLEEEAEDAEEEPVQKTTRGRKGKASEEEDEEEEPPKKTTRGRQAKEPEEQPGEEPAVKKTTYGRKGKAVEEVEDEDTEEQPGKKTTKGRKGTALEEEDEDIDEEEPPKKTTQGRQAKEPEEQPKDDEEEPVAEEPTQKRTERPAPASRKATQADPSKSKIPVMKKGTQEKKGPVQEEVQHDEEEEVHEEQDGVVEDEVFDEAPVEDVPAEQNPVVNSPRRSANRPASTSEAPVASAAPRSSRLPSIIPGDTPSLAGDRPRKRVSFNSRIDFRQVESQQSQSQSQSGGSQAEEGEEEEEEEVEEETAGMTTDVTSGISEDDRTYRPSSSRTSYPSDATGSLTVEPTVHSDAEESQENRYPFDLDVTRRVRLIKQTCPKELIGKDIFLPDMEHPDLRRSRRVRKRYRHPLERMLGPPPLRIVKDKNDLICAVRPLPPREENKRKRNVTTKTKSGATRSRKAARREADDINRAFDDYLDEQDGQSAPVRDEEEEEPEWPRDDNGAAVDAERIVKIAGFGEFLLKGDVEHSRARLRNANNTVCVCPTILKRDRDGQALYATGLVYVKPDARTRAISAQGAECFMLTKAYGSPTVTVLIKDDDDGEDKKALVTILDVGDSVIVPPGCKYIIKNDTQKLAIVNFTSFKTTSDVE